MDCFLNHNTKQIEISGNSPLVLNQSDKIYVVTSDDLDIFVVSMVDGRPAGARRHLFTASKGALLCGIETEGHSSGLGLLAAGKPGSAVLEASKNDILTASTQQDPQIRKDIRNKIEGWIKNLSISLYQRVSPRKISLLVPGEHKLQLNENVKINPGQKLLWLRHTKGSSTCFIQPHLLSAVDDSYFPLPQRGWISSVEESFVHCLSSEEYQERNPDYKDLTAFHDSVFSCLLDLQKASEAEEQVRQTAMIKSDQALLASTTTLLAQSMTTGSKKIDAAIISDDEFLTACRMVGEQAGIKVSAPPREAQINTDPIQAIAKGSRFRIRKVALVKGWWKSDAGPMLGFIADASSAEERPAALLQKSNSYFVVDPRTGIRRKVDQKVNDELGMFAYAFYRPMPIRPISVLDIYSHGLFKTRKDQIRLLLMASLGALLTLLTPISTGIIFDNIIPEADRYGLVFVGAILLSAAIAKGLFEITKSIATIRLTGKADYALQAGIMDRLLSLPTSFFRKYTAGDLAERTLAINGIREILSGITVNAIISGVFSVFNLALLFYYSANLAWVAMGITFFSVLIISGIGYLQIQYQREIQQSHGQISGMVLQFITGISKLRISGTEDRAFAKWAEAFSAMRHASYRSRSVTNHLQAFSSALPVISMFILFFWIVFNSLTQQLSVGAIIAFFAAFTQFQNALIQMSIALISSLQVFPMYDRAKPIFESIPEVNTDKADPGELFGDIELNNLNFQYEPDGPLILDDISMQIAAGEFIALLGSSGSGKSTLLRLLLGFETPGAGSIYYDGQDMAGLDITAIRRQLGVVLQKDMVMSGDIFSNIIGSSNLTIDDAWEAARKAGLEEDIKDMPMGMHTMIPSGGGTLSGGQRQRLLIARAIVHKPRIIFFDEATSALDNVTQKQVSDSLEKLNATRVVIAHRLSTIVNADKIFFLDKGKIVQQGTYNELINQPGLFADLAKRQLT